MATYHRTLLLVEVLGDRPFGGDLEDLGEAITTGDFSGAVLMSSHTAVDAAQIAQLLIMQGSDPEFLLGSLDDDEEDGEDGEDGDFGDEVGVDGDASASA